MEGLGVSRRVGRNQVETVFGPTLSNTCRTLFRPWTHVFRSFRTPPLHNVFRRTDRKLFSSSTCTYEHVWAGLVTNGWSAAQPLLCTDHYHHCNILGTVIFWVPQDQEGSVRVSGREQPSGATRHHDVSPARRRHRIRASRCIVERRSRRLAARDRSPCGSRARLEPSRAHEAPPLRHRLQNRRPPRPHCAAASALARRVQRRSHDGYTTVTRRWHDGHTTGPAAGSSRDHVGSSRTRDSAIA